MLKINVRCDLQLRSDQTNHLSIKNLESHPNVKSVTPQRTVTRTLHYVDTELNDLSEAEEEPEETPHFVNFN